MRGASPLRSGAYFETRIEREEGEPQIEQLESGKEALHSSEADEISSFLPSPSCDGWISFVSVWVTHLGEGGGRGRLVPNWEVREVNGDGADGVAIKGRYNLSPYESAIYFDALRVRD